MRTIGTAILLVGALVAPFSTAYAWNLAACPPEVAQRKAELARELRAAKPGTLRYLPKPFPKNGVEVVENYKHEVLSRWSSIPAEQLDAGRRALLDGLRRNSLAIEIERVQNWQVRRCSDISTGDSYHLLRIYDRASGREIARAALQESGAIEQTGFAGEHDMPLPELAAAAESVRNTTGLPVQSPVYITSVGTLRCDVLMPCVAVRAQSSVFLVDQDGELFEIPAQRHMLSFRKDLGSDEQRVAKQKELGPRNEVVTSLGGDQFVVAKRHGRLKKRN